MDSNVLEQSKITIHTKVLVVKETMKRFYTLYKIATAPIFLYCLAMAASEFIYPEKVPEIHPQVIQYEKPVESNTYQPQTDEKIDLSEYI